MFKLISLFCLLLIDLTTSLSSTDVEPSFASMSYIALVKGKAALPCHVTTTLPDDSVALILWYKDDSFAPIYTLDARKGSLDQARTLIAPSVQGRAYFYLYHHPAFLQIEPLQLTDAGDYRCRVDFKKARTMNTVINLKVIVPPNKPQIKSSEKVILSGLTEPYNEGSTLKLTCTATGGKPRPSLTWWQNSQLIDDSFEYVDKELTTNQLIIPNLTRHHLLSKFVCQASNNNMTVAPTASITLELNLKPTEVHINQISSELVAEREATFECIALGSRPKPTIYWIFNGKRHNTTVTGDQALDQTMRARITLLIKTQHHKSTLTCVAENSQIAKSAISDKFHLDVQYIPKVSIVLGSPTLSLQSIQEGNDIYFDCKIDANPRPNKPTVWKYNGMLLYPKQGIIQSNQTLVLQRVSRTQSGIYQCEAGNRHGNALSDEIHLKIKHAPVCKTNKISLYGVIIPETISLLCTVKAHPSKTSFQWKFQSRFNSGHLITFNDTLPSLTYTIRSSKDLGTIYCLGKNEIGLQQKPCTLIITHAEPPDFAFQCKVTNLTQRAFTIMCDPQPNNNLNESNSIEDELFDYETTTLIHPPTVYVCETYLKNQPILVSNVTGSLKKTHTLLTDDDHSLSRSTIIFFVINLHPLTKFRNKIYAQNTKGSSKVVWLEVQTLRSPEQLIDNLQKSLQEDGVLINTASIIRGKSVFITLLIGIGIALLAIIFLAFATIVRVKRRAQPKSGQSESKTDSNCGETEANETVFAFDEEAECYCDNDHYNEAMIRSAKCQQQQNSTNSSDAHTKGPPDIIPSFGAYSDFDLDQKHYYPIANINLNYAELNFAQNNHPLYSLSSGDKIKYAKIEYQNQRVKIIDDGTKFESTV